MKLAVLYQSQALLRVRSLETRMLSACRWISTLAMIVMMGSCLANTAASQLDSPDNTTVSHAVNFRDGRLSLSANGVSLAVLIQLVGDKAGFEVIIKGELEAQRGSWAFTDLTLNEAVRRLLRDINSIIVYRPGSDDAESTISRIYLLGSGSGSDNPGPIRIDTVTKCIDFEDALKKFGPRNAAFRSEFLVSLRRRPSRAAPVRGLSIRGERGDFGRHFDRGGL